MGQSLLRNFADAWVAPENDALSMREGHEDYPHGSIGHDLARERLAARARRLEAAREALYARAEASRREGMPLPSPLRSAIADFTTALRRRARRTSARTRCTLSAALGVASSALSEA